MYLEAKNLKELLLDVKTRYIICGAQGEMETPGTPSKNQKLLRTARQQQQGINQMKGPTKCEVLWNYISPIPMKLALLKV